MATPCQNYLQTTQTQLDAQILSNPYLLTTNQYQKQNESKLLLLTITKLLHHILHNREISERILIQNKNILNKIQEQQTQINHIQQIKELNNNNNTTILEELSAAFSSVRGDVHEMASTIVNSDDYAANKIKCLFPKMFQCLERNMTNNIIRHTNHMIHTIYNNINNTANTSQQTQPPPNKPTDQPLNIANSRNDNKKPSQTNNTTAAPIHSHSLQQQSKTSEPIVKQQQKPSKNTTTLPNKSIDIIQSILPTKESQNGPHNHLQTKLISEKSKTNLIQLKSLQMHTNKQQTPNNTTTLQIKPRSSHIKSTDLPIEPLTTREAKLNPSNCSAIMDTSIDENKNINKINKNNPSPNPLRKKNKLLNQSQTKPQIPLDSFTLLNTSIDENILINSPAIATVSAPIKINIKSLVTSHKPSPIEPLHEKKALSIPPKPHTHLNENNIKMDNIKSPCSDSVTPSPINKPPKHSKLPRSPAQNDTTISSVKPRTSHSKSYELPIESLTLNETKLIPLDSSVILDTFMDENKNTNKINSKENVKSPSTEFVPLREKNKLLNKPQINYNIIQLKKKKIKKNNNNKQKNKFKVKKHQKNKKKTKIIKKNKNHLKKQKIQLNRLKKDENENNNQLFKSKNDEIENIIINYKFSQDIYDDWVDFKKNIRELSAKEYYEMLNGKIPDKLIKQWLDAYRPTRLMN